MPSRSALLNHMVNAHGTNKTVLIDRSYRTDHRKYLRIPLVRILTVALYVYSVRHLTTESHTLMTDTEANKPMMEHTLVRYVNNPTSNFIPKQWTSACAFFGFSFFKSHDNVLFFFRLLFTQGWDYWKRVGSKSSVIILLCLANVLWINQTNWIHK